MKDWYLRWKRDSLGKLHSWCLRCGSGRSRRFRYHLSGITVWNFHFRLLGTRICRKRIGNLWSPLVGIQNHGRGCGSRGTTFWACRARLMCRNFLCLGKSLMTEWSHYDGGFRGLFAACLAGWKVSIARLARIRRGRCCGKTGSCCLSCALCSFSSGTSGQSGFGNFKIFCERRVFGENNLVYL